MERNWIGWSRNDPCIVSGLTLHRLVLLQSLDKGPIGPHELLNSSSVENGAEAIDENESGKTGTNGGLRRTLDCSS